VNKTRIEWCDFTWNPVVGCTHGCPYCYARRMARRFWGDTTFRPRWADKNFARKMPKQPSRIFVNSMSDPADWEQAWTMTVLARIREHPEHRFLFLTKRPWVYHRDQYPENCWLGVTATTEEEVKRRQQMLTLSNQERLRFLSIEPIAERISPTLIDRETIRWLIVGAETGNRRGKVVPRREWIEALRTCGVPVFEKESLRRIMGGELRRQFPVERPKPAGLFVEIGGEEVLW
jgi:protein gp37